MKFNLLHVYTLLSLALVGSHAVRPQVYWNSMLPKTPMPKLIKDLLYTKAWDDGMEKVTTNTAPMYLKVQEQSQQCYSNVASKDEVKKDHPQNQLIVRGAPNYEVKDHPSFQLGQFLEWQPFLEWEPFENGAKDHPRNQPIVRGAPDDEVKDHPSFHLGQFLEWQPFLEWERVKYGAKDHPQNQPIVRGAPDDEVKDHPSFHVGQFLEWQPFLDWEPFYEAKDHPRNQPTVRDESDDEVKDHAPKEEAKDSPFAKLMLLENDLHQGKEMMLQFNINGDIAKFLPKDIVDSIPFSSKDLPEIYKMFSVKPDSMEAKAMKRAINTCDPRRRAINEEKVCATSLESMIDFVTTKLGKRVKALSTEKAKESSVPQKYTLQLVKKLATNEVVICHRIIYPYAVFYCHLINGTQPYVVSLEGADGTKVKSTAVCHTKTSTFDPKHMAFQLLKVTPGTPVCHFLLEDTVLWVPY